MLLIKNGYIKTMAGDDLENGCILIDDNGKILEVGKDITPLVQVQVIDAGGRLVTPGCVDAHSHIGMWNECMNWEGADGNESSDPLTPQLRAIDSINPIDEAFENAVKGGVTAACTGPGSANVVGGTFAAIKLHGKRIDNMIIKSPAAMKCAFGENPKGVYGKSGKAPKTRMATAAMLRELLFKAKRYCEDKENGKNPSFDMKLEAMIPVIKGEIPLKAHAHRADDILTSIRIAKEFGVKLTLDHCTDGALIADELAKEGYPAFVGPTPFGRKSKVELSNKSLETVSVLHKAGVKVSIITDSPVITQENLPLCAAMAVTAGLDVEVAWRAITINPATSLGISDRIGSLEKGKDADIVIWTADPMTTVGAQSYITLIDGKVVYSEI
jgi:imidazolonepropionase-like amidohydrolase